MKVSAVKPAPALNKQAQPVEQPLQSFETVRTQLERAMQAPGLKDVERILSSRSPAPRELLMAQMKISEFHLKVEFVSRAAEAGLATLRKFQQGQ